MERSQLFDLMGELKLYGMKAAFDEIMATAVKRQHEPQRIIGDLLTAEVNEKQARSIKYQLTIAKLPLAKDLDDFRFEDTPINETLVRDLAGGDFIAQQRNAVLVGGTGTGKTHLAIAIARSCIRSGTRGRFYNVVDLVNRLETETRNGRQGRIADQLTRMDFVILDELLAFRIGVFCLQDLTPEDDADGCRGTHYCDLTRGPRDVHVGPDVFGAHDVVGPAVSFPGNDRHLGHRGFRKCI